MENNKKILKVGSDFSGVGAFNQALKRLCVEYKELFACDMDKYARKTYIHNYGEPDYFPLNVYDREIPRESLDIFMTSPPCQTFSIAGRRMGKNDKRGILFFNSLEFIQKNKPRYFIFENVKGLLSDDGGKTFSEWVNLLGGKSVNGNPVIFPYEDSVPYHLYWQVLNSKHYGVPQNRERVFLVGIRDDNDNNFRFPPKEHLTKRLKDILEENVAEKYYLSDKILNFFDRHREKRNSGNKYPLDENYVVNCIAAGYGNNCAEQPYFNQEIIIHDMPEMVRVRKYDVDVAKIQECLKKHRKKSIKQIADELSVNKTTVEHWFRTDKHFSIPDAEIWFELKKFLNIETDEFDLSITEFIEKENVFEKANRVYDENGIAPTMTSTSADEKILTQSNEPETKRLGMTSAMGMGGGFTPSIIEKKEDNSVDDNNENIKIGDIRRDVGIRWRIDGNSPTLCSQSRDDMQSSPIIHNCLTQAIGKRGSSEEYIESCKKVYQATHKIRRLTPRECFRLMDFDDSFDFSVVSDSQAYKQAGNSIVVAVLYKILKNLKIN
jgi:DNA (cytosine-5)-methyltransferase 1